MNEEREIERGKFFLCGQKGNHGKNQAKRRVDKMKAKKVMKKDERSKRVKNTRSFFLITKRTKLEDSQGRETKIRE